MLSSPHGRAPGLVSQGRALWRGGCHIWWVGAWKKLAKNDGAHQPLVFHRRGTRTGPTWLFPDVAPGKGGRGVAIKLLWPRNHCRSQVRPCWMPLVQPVLRNGNTSSLPWCVWQQRDTQEWLLAQDYLRITCILSARVTGNFPRLSGETRSKLSFWPSLLKTNEMVCNCR